MPVYVVIVCLNIVIGDLSTSGNLCFFGFSFVLGSNYGYFEFSKLKLCFCTK